MGDSSCIIQPFEHTSLQQGDPAVRALTESVSFGRFVTDTLEWGKWSTFSQNRYLEEAKRSSKPGLVAQKKALLEAHFKQIAADRAAVAALLEVEVSNSSTDCKPCLDLESGKFDRCCSADAAQTSSEADGSSVVDISSQSGETYCVERNASVAAVSDLVCVNKSNDAANSVQMDEPRSYLDEDLEACDKVDTLYHTSQSNHMSEAVKPSSSQKPDSPDAMQTEFDELYHSEVVNTSTTLLDDPQNTAAVREPVDQFVVASPGKNKANRSCSKTLVSVTKPAVQSNWIPSRPPAFPKKDNHTTRSTNAFGSAMLNKKKETTKSLHTTINLKSSHLDFKGPPIPKKIVSAKGSASSVSLRSSKERPGSSQVSTNIGSQKKQATASGSLSAIRRSSAELYIRPAPSQLKKHDTVMRRDSASMRGALVMRKSKTNALHMSINLDSHVGEKKKLVSLPRTGIKIDATSTRMSTTHSTHASANQVILDSSLRRKQIIPIPNSSADVRKLIMQFHAKPAPLLYRNKSSSISCNGPLTLSHADIKKHTPKSLHLSVDLRNTVGVVTKPSLSQKRAVSASIQGSLKESIQTANGMKDTEKCSLQKMDRPETLRKLIRPLSPTLSTPFRFRSGERAAKRKDMLEEKYKVESENFLQRKGKFSQLRPQSPIFAGKPTPGKPRETKNFKPLQSPAKGKAATVNKTSTSISLLPRKTASENASPNIEIQMKYD